MSNLSCAFNVEEPLEKTCKYCAMPLGRTVLQKTDPENPACPVCQNRKLTDAILKTSVNLVLYAILILVPMVLVGFISFTNAMWVVVGFASLTIVAQKISYPAMFRGLENKQRIIPALHYFRINKDLGYYKVALRYAKKTDEAFLKSHEDKYFPYIVMYILLSEADIPTDWEKDWATAFHMEKTQFLNDVMDHVKTLVEEYPIVFSMGFIPEILKLAKELERNDVFTVLINNIQENIKKIKKIDIDEKQVKTFYEDIFLAEDILKEAMEEQPELKEAITFILNEMNKNYTPPEVPRSLADMIRMSKEAIDKEKQMKQPMNEDS